MIALGSIEATDTGSWGVLAASGWRAHFWRVATSIEEVNGTLLQAACGRYGATNHAFPLLDAGDFPRCKLCERGLT